MRRTTLSRATAAAVGTLAMFATTALTGAVPATAALSASAAPAPIPAAIGHRMVSGQFPTPLTPSQCQAQFQASCYGATQLEQGYDEHPLLDRGINGAGRTIVIVDSFGSPTIQHDLDVYSAQYGIPSTNVQVVKWGTVPPFDPGNSDMTGWAEETTIDVDMAHAMAPGAKIVLVETGVSEQEGTTGFPEMMAAEDSLIKQGVGDVITQSFGATENTFPGFDQGDYSSLLNLRYAYKDAAAHGVTVLASSGDNGVTDAESDGSTLYPYPVTSWPPSDPLVTGVGGTTVKLDDNGNRLSPDSVWDDPSTGGGASGGGKSKVFSRPLFQLGVQSTVGNSRGVPDISMVGDPNTGVWTYNSFGPQDDGWELWGGTSVASPVFSGVVALADQVAGHRLGNLNYGLYALGAAQQAGAKWTGINDVVGGSNTYNNVPGWPVTPGYDMATGWGTVDVAKFVPTIAALG
ncbi:subtilase family serine protease [Kitasatospora sp. GAS204A]|uniref:S53 family peptidase n=1 Tax=unclassified Kitasatospora TaxID=2633591 RepID=UPI002476C4EC|nr:S53 family peptidase [Kitasatospora sp. GAS204B]MDH6118449.1 subtilase family serine protease [Kitasatospora sp. GAS204B]